LHYASCRRVLYSRVLYSRVLYSRILHSRVLHSRVLHSCIFTRLAFTRLSRVFLASCIHASSIRSSCGRVFHASFTRPAPGGRPGPVFDGCERERETGGGAKKTTAGRQTVTRTDGHSWLDLKESVTLGRAPAREMRRIVWWGGYDPPPSSDRGAQNTLGAQGAQGPHNTQPT
jgi:hypothetical protein